MAERARGRDVKMQKNHRSLLRQTTEEEEKKHHSRSTLLPMKWRVLFRFIVCC